MKEIDITKIPAYQLVKKEDIEELSTTGYLLKHKKSGARVLLLVNDDNNKVFNIGFRTPPADDTGVPRIMRLKEVSSERSVRRTGQRLFKYIFKCNDLPG